MSSKEPVRAVHTTGEDYRFRQGFTWRSARNLGSGARLEDHYELGRVKVS